MVCLQKEIHFTSFAVFVRLFVLSRQFLSNALTDKAQSDVDEGACEGPLELMTHGQTQPITSFHVCVCVCAELSDIWQPVLQLTTDAQSPEKRRQNRRDLFEGNG